MNKEIQELRKDVEILEADVISLEIECDNKIGRAHV